ncbi:MAG: hypothetical protein WCG04_00930 [Alphaproteobacteria bacterium]
MTHTTQAAALSQDALEQYRPGNNLPEIDVQSYPRTTSLKDGLELCQSLVRSTVEAWQRSQQLFVDENKRIIDIMGALSRSGNSLLASMNILGDDNDFNLYSIYKSYSKIINILIELDSLLLKINPPSSFKDSNEESRIIKEIIISLNKNTKNNEGDALLTKSLMQSSTSSLLSKKPADIQRRMRLLTKAQSRDIRNPLPEDDSKYVLCDVEYVSQVFLPMVKAILQQTHSAPSLQAKKKKRRHRKKKQQNAALVAEQNDDETTPSSEEKREDSVASEAYQVPAPIASSAQESEVDETYDLKPWEAYAQINDENRRPQIPQKTAPQALVLGRKRSVTARTLLGAEAGKVSMVNYKKLLNALNGAVVDHKKSIHFIARSLSSGTWCSVAMHRLHGDDAANIPHGTRYWQIAKQLLIDIGLSEANLSD